MAKKKTVTMKAPTAPKVLEEEKRVDIVSKDGAVVQFIFFTGKGCTFNVVCVNQAAIDRVAYFQDLEVGQHVYENDCLPDEPKPEPEEEE